MQMPLLQIWGDVARFKKTPNSLCSRKIQETQTGRAAKKCTLLGVLCLLPVPLHPSLPSSLPLEAPRVDDINRFPASAFWVVWLLGETSGQRVRCDVYNPGSCPSGFLRLAASPHQMPPPLYDMLLPGLGHHFSLSLGL